MKCFVFLLALLLSPQAAACSIFLGHPPEVFEESQIVVMAHPVAISHRPERAANRNYDGSFRQTVLWEVLLSWKGGLKSGDRFTTRREFFSSSGCTSYFPVRDQAAYLIFGRGREPYEDFHNLDPAYASYYFRYLSDRPASDVGGT